MSKKQHNNLLLRPNEAARMLSISPRTLWSLTASSQIPHVRIGRSVRYSVEGLQRWIDDRMKEGDQ